MKFEDAGRALDRELEKLRKFFQNEVRPETRKETADLLRKSAARLARLADRLERDKEESET